MEIEIRNILRKYLEERIVNKIEIKSLVARKKEKIKAYGVPELLKCSFDKMGEAITSATSKKFSQEIAGMCKKFVEDKLSFIDKIFKDEYELLQYLKSSSNFDDDEEDYPHQPRNRRPFRPLSFTNTYRKSNYNFVENFVNILNNKFKQVYINLNGNFQSEENYIFVYIDKTLNSIKNNLEKFFSSRFEDYNNSKFKDYYHELLMKQSALNQKYNTNNQIKNAKEIEEECKEELFKYFENECFKVYLCIIVRLFKGNLQNILEGHFKRVIKENEKIISQKAEASLKNVTKRLKDKLLNELDEYYPKEKEEIEDNKILPNPSELSSESLKVDFEFTF